MVEIRVKFDSVKFSNDAKQIVRKVREAMTDLASFVQKSAKLRAPRFTGNLASNITVHSASQDSMIIKSTAHYAAEQERGKDLPRIKRVTKHMKDWALFHGYHRALQSKYWTIRNYKPHLHPALDEGMKRFPSMLNRRLGEVR